jgi:hypothetical protein
MDNRSRVGSVYADESISKVRQESGYGCVQEADLPLIPIFLILPSACKSLNTLTALMIFSSPSPLSCPRFSGPSPQATAYSSS